MKGIVTLCGSHCFKDIFEEVAQILGMSGWVVLRPAFAVNAHEYALPTDGKKGLKQRFDDLHMEKIGMSQAIIVINHENYIGDSTRREIDYAKQLKKQIYWHEKPTYAIGKPFEGKWETGDLWTKLIDPEVVELLAKQ